MTVIFQVTTLETGDLSCSGGCGMIEPAPDAIVETSPVMTLWHYNLANSIYGRFIDVVKDDRVHGRVVSNQNTVFSSTR